MPQLHPLSVQGQAAPAHAVQRLQVLQHRHGVGQLAFLGEHDAFRRQADEELQLPLGVARLHEATLVAVLKRHMLQTRPGHHSGVVTPRVRRQLGVESGDVHELRHVHAAAERPHVRAHARE
eukprot:scaffold1667_cov258-Pinguiococcus_pyrenoidosus.AAC.3